jgi:hypothetical protein
MNSQAFANRRVRREPNRNQTFDCALDAPQVPPLRFAPVGMTSLGVVLWLNLLLI